MAFEPEVLFNLNDPLPVLFVQIRTFMQNPLGSTLNNENGSHFAESSALGAVTGAEQVDRGQESLRSPRWPLQAVGQLSTPLL